MRGILAEGYIRPEHIAGLLGLFVFLSGRQGFGFCLTIKPLVFITAGIAAVRPLLQALFLFTRHWITSFLFFEPEIRFAGIRSENDRTIFNDDISSGNKIQIDGLRISVIIRRSDIKISIDFAIKHIS